MCIIQVTDNNGCAAQNGAAVSVVQITISSADITQDNVTVSLAGSGSGNLTVKATGPNGSSPVDPIFNGTVGAGTNHYHFGLSNIPIGEYTQITATWQGASATFQYHFKVLGTYRQTQYNTPAESQCSGSPQAVTVYASNCSSAAGVMKNGFVFRMTNPAGGTGSGHSISYADVAQEAFCTHGNQSAFRKNYTITGTLGSLSNSTVAACQTSELYASGTRVFIVGEGVKTVTDRCPACCTDTTHLDNYTTNTACSGVGSLPNALTIRLY